MNVPRVSDAAIEVLRYLLDHPSLTDYQLDRHILNVHGPVAVREVHAELERLGLAEGPVDQQSRRRRWRVTPEGERVARSERS
jgi:hypothetical protein